MNNTSINKVLEQIVSFKKDIKGALELLEFEENFDKDKVNLINKLSRK